MSDLTKTSKQHYKYFQRPKGIRAQKVKEGTMTRAHQILNTN